MEKKFIWIGIGVLGLVLLMGVVGYVVMRANQSFHGSVIDPPSRAADHCPLHERASLASG